MRLLWELLRFLQHQLYTRLAWAYDAVAWAVSLGQWRTWQSAGLEAVAPGSLLEIGHGPGHLLVERGLAGYPAVGLDLSPQMARQARRRLQRAGLKPRLIRARAQRMPLRTGSFESILSTFPSEFLLDPETLVEAHRVLRPGGRFVVVPVVRIKRGRLGDRIAAWLQRVTGEDREPFPSPAEIFARAGFDLRVDRVQQPRATVLRFVAVRRGIQAT
jgi:ubiquinone/menaquinone biosynthesis C-methylase UbiE